MSFKSSTISGFRLAFRASFFQLAGGSLLVTTFAAALAAQFSGRQPTTVAMDIGISVIRLLLPLFLVLMTQELLAREFDRRYSLNTLSYPHPRHSLLLGRLAAIAILTLGLLFALGAVLGLFVWFIGKGYEQSTPVSLGIHYLTTIAFIALDLMLLASVTVLLAVVASTPSFLLVGTFGFMFVARSFGAIVDLLTRNATVVNDAETYRSTVGSLRYLLPDLGALDIRMVTLYGRMDLLPSDWPWLILSTVTYAFGMIGLAVLALRNKRFV